MYAVVTFTSNEDDESVEAVPLAWLTPRKKHCHWSPFKKLDRISKAIKDAVEPGDDWQCSEAKCLKTYGNYPCINRLKVCFHGVSYGNSGHFWLSNSLQLNLMSFYLFSSSRIK